MDSLRYSTWGIIRQCLLVLFIALVIGGLFFLPSHGNPAAYRRIGPVRTSIAVMLIGYGAIVQAVRTWLLLGNEGVALTASAHGIDLHGVWLRRSFAWNEIKSIALERRSTRNGHHYVIAISGLAGWKKRYDVEPDCSGDRSMRSEAGRTRPRRSSSRAVVFRLRRRQAGCQASSGGGTRRESRKLGGEASSSRYTPLHFAGASTRP